jgi:hypothetical protein
MNPLSLAKSSGCDNKRLSAKVPIAKTLDISAFSAVRVKNIYIYRGE